MLCPVTKEQAAWVQSQPVVGSPGLTRLRIAFTTTGFTPVAVGLEDKGRTVSFSLLRNAGLQELDREHVLRVVISLLRRAGFEVGFGEVCINYLDESVVKGVTLTGPRSEVCFIGPPPVEP